MVDPVASSKASGRVSWRRPSWLGVAAIVGVCLFPYLSFLDGNRGEVIPVGRLVTYAALTTAVGLGCYLVALCTTRVAADRLAVPVAVVVLSFFTFAWWLDPDPVESRRVIQILVWSGVTAGFAVVLFRLSRLAVMRQWLLFLAAFLPVVPTVAFVSYEIRAVDPDSSSDGGFPLAMDGDERPNVYHFVLDFHGRGDQLDALVGTDGSMFERQLEQRDFVVATGAIASYPVTGLSIPSTMETNYVATSPEDLSGGIDEFNDAIRGDSAVVEAFRDNGYEFVYSANGAFSSSDCSRDLADRCLSPSSSGASTDDFTQQILAMTPLGSLDLFNSPYTDPVQVVEQLRADPPTSPFFLFAHVISPHPPYRFDDDCTRKAHAVERLTLDADEERSQYATEVACIDELMIDAIDQIVAADPDALIIVQSDHGSEFLTNWYWDLDSWSDEALAERYSVLNAMRLPADCEPPRPDEALVNTYRLVFACLGEGRPERLDPRAFLFRWGADHDLEEIPIERLDLDGER